MRKPALRADAGVLDGVRLVHLAEFERACLAETLLLARLASAGK